MKRVFGTILLLLLAGIGLLWPLVADVTSTQSGESRATDPVVVTNYAAVYNVSADGTLDATETVTGMFPYGRHGIFRFWDVADPSDAHVRYQPKVGRVTMDGAPVRVEYSWQGGGRFLVAKIGEPDSFVAPGSHAYEISYSIAGVISPISAGQGKVFVSAQGLTSPGPARSDFNWNVVAQGWQMAIQLAAIQINLPAAASKIQCSAGLPSGDGFTEGPCKISGAGTNHINLNASGIPPRSGMTVRATMAPPPPPRVSVPWPVRWDPILGTRPGFAGAVVALTVIAIAIGAWLALRAREAAPGFPIMYAPPSGLGPVQTVYIDTEETGANGLTSSLFYLADKRLVNLERGEGDTWIVTGRGTPEEWMAVDAVSRGVAADLGVVKAGSRFLADRSKGAGKKLQTAREHIDRAARHWASNGGLTRGVVAEKLAKLVWVLCAAGAAAGFIGLLGVTMVGLPFAGYAIGGFGLMRAAVGMRRTAAGRRVWSEAGGFRRLLATESSEARFDFSARKDMFISLIPFAVAFGVADGWAAKYKAATGQDAPVPPWYPIGYGASAGFYASGGGFDSFDSALAASISAYQASQSSGGGGGGGSSGFGGGGGGGGGGSW